MIIVRWTNWRICFKQAEILLSQLTERGREAGIHLVTSTQSHSSHDRYFPVRLVSVVADKDEALYATDILNSAANTSWCQEASIRCRRRLVNRRVIEHRCFGHGVGRYLRDNDRRSRGVHMKCSWIAIEIAFPDHPTGIEWNSHTTLCSFVDVLPPTIRLVWDRKVGGSGWKRRFNNTRRRDCTGVVYRYRPYAYHRHDRFG